MELATAQWSSEGHGMQGTSSHPETKRLYHPAAKSAHNENRNLFISIVEVMQSPLEGKPSHFAHFVENSKVSLSRVTSISAKRVLFLSLTTTEETKIYPKPPFLTGDMITTAGLLPLAGFLHGPTDLIKRISG